MSRLLAAIGFAVLTNAVLVVPAWAHAHLKSSVPADQAHVAAPAELDLYFTEGLNLAFSGIKLIGPDQQAIKLEEGMLMDGDKTLMVSLPNTLKPGTYTVQWHALAIDGHKTNGSYQFTVTP